MSTILADSFNVALARLSNGEQKQVKITAYDLQVNPDQPGLQFHRIDKSKDPNFWSLRVSRDLRIIVHKHGDSLMLAYVGHHDDAYKWAERRRIETHPRTGAVQIVEVRERIEDVSATPIEVQPELALATQPPASPPLFNALRDDDLFSIGVPVDWLADVKAATEDRFFELAPHLPAEASEALLEYAAIGVLKPAALPTENPLAHPDSQRRFRVLEDVEELRAALDAPFQKWTVFLHPSQRGIVERDYSGPARVAGSAGTGKTVVVLHRVQRILKSGSDSKVLLTTFSRPLANSLDVKLRLLIGDHPGLLDRVTISAFNDVAADLYALATGRKPHIVADDALRSTLARAAKEAKLTEVTPQFLNSEWVHVIDPWQIDDADAYGEVPRMGRKNRLGPRQRERLWPVFGAVREALQRRGTMTEAMVFAETAKHYGDRADKPFTHIVVDEAQDLSVAALRFLSAIAPNTPGALFFAGDLGQRIFQQPFSWKGLGIDVRGRSSALRVNYRTSHQIRRAADRLLPKNIRDVDGLEDNRAGTISVFDGPEPEILIASGEEHEIAQVAVRLRAAVAEGFVPAEIGIFVRSSEQLSRARAAADLAGLQVRAFADRKAQGEEAALVSTMHLAKGLEFQLVVVMACDQGVLPLAERVSQVADDFELDEVLATERQLFYVAATRARDRLIISGKQPVSEFIEDFRAR